MPPVPVRRSRFSSPSHAPAFLDRERGSQIGRRSKWIVIRFASGSTWGVAGRKRNRNKGARRPVLRACFTSIRCRLKLSHHLLASFFSHFLVPSRKWCIADYLDFLRVSPVLLVLLSHPSCRLRRVVCQEQETGLPIEARSLGTWLIREMRTFGVHNVSPCAFYRAIIILSNANYIVYSRSSHFVM